MFSLVKTGQVWRFLTYGVLHGNLVHLFGNVVSQLMVGSLIEHQLGLTKTTLLYWLSSIGGGLFSQLINKGNTVGASVAIFGLLGAYVLLSLLLRSPSQ
jgi:rhomboid protease GluP